MNDYIIIGMILKPVGIKGELKVLPLTEKIKRFDELDELYIQIGQRLAIHTIEKVYYKRNMVYIRFTEIDTVEKAESLRNCYLKIHKNKAIKLENGSYFVFDIIGLNVYLEGEEFVGVVKDVLQTGSNDVYVVRYKNEREVLIPALKEVVKDIQVDTGKIYIKKIEGIEL